MCRLSYFTCLRSVYIASPVEPVIPIHIFKWSAGMYFFNIVVFDNSDVNHCKSDFIFLIFNEYLYDLNKQKKKPSADVFLLLLTRYQHAGRIDASWLD